MGALRSPRVGSLAVALPVSLVEPDGLIVTTDGRYVRLVQCDRPPNTITADPSELSRITDAFAALCRIVPVRQTISIHAQTDPVPPYEALAGDHEATATAAVQDRADRNDALARARNRR